MKDFKLQYKLMGSAFELGIVENDEIKANELLETGVAEIQRIEALLTEFKPTSFTSKINLNAGIEPVKVDTETFQLIERCHRISSLTTGCFDITVGPLKKLYNFKNENFEFPSRKTISETLNKTGFQHIVLEASNHSIFLKNKGMHISFAAIGKGYAADCVKKLWQKSGVNSGFINASGDITAFGTKADGSPWKIGIANPDDKNEMLFHIPLNNGSVATSGDYEQFFLFNGKRHSHNIHPKTGMPLTGIKSVSIFAPSAELADALATAVYVMGKKTGIDFINQLPQTHCIIIDEDNRKYYSKNLHLQHEAFA